MCSPGANASRKCNSTSPYQVQSVVNALDLLETLAEETHNLTVSYLAHKLGLSRNKVTRLLAILEKRELVVCDAISGGYSLGLSAVGLAQSFLRNVTGKGGVTEYRLTYR